MVEFVNLLLAPLLKASLLDLLVELLDEPSVALGGLGGPCEVHRVAHRVGGDGVLAVELGVYGVDHALGLVGELIEGLLVVGVLPPLDDKASLDKHVEVVGVHLQ